MFSFLKRKISYKHKLTQILTLINEIKEEEIEKEMKIFIDQISLINNDDLTKIDKDISQGKSISETLHGRIKISDFDENFLSNFVSKYSQEMQKEPTKAEEAYVYYQSLCLCCQKDKFTKDNFRLIINSLSFCISNSFLNSDYGKCCFILVLTEAINNDSFIFDTFTIEQIMSIFQNKNSFSKEDFEHIYLLTKRILTGNKEDVEEKPSPKEAIFSALSSYIKTQIKKFNISYFPEILKLIDPYIIDLNPRALVLMWEILKYQDMLSYGRRHMINIISAIVNKIASKNPIKIEKGENIGVFHKNGEAHTKPFQSLFDNHLVPYDYLFYPSENYFQETLGDDILQLLSILIDSMKHESASQQAVEEFFRCFEIQEDIIAAIVFIYMLLTFKLDTKEWCVQKLLNSFIFNSEEGVYGPVLISYNNSQLRTMAIKYCDKGNNVNSSLLQKLQETKHFLVFCDLFARYNIVYGKKFVIGKDIADKLINTNRSLIEFQENECTMSPKTRENNDKSLICKAARSSLFISLFESTVSGECEIVESILEIGQERSLCEYSALLIAKTLPSLTEESLEKVKEMIKNNPEFARILIENLVNFSRTDNMCNQIDLLADSFIDVLDNCCNENILFALLCILTNCSFSFTLKPNKAKILVSSIVSTKSQRILDMIFTLNTCESFYSGFYTYYRPSFIILLFADIDSKITQDRILKSLRELQNIIYMNEAGIDEMLIDVIRTGETIYNGQKLPLKIDQNLCRQMLRKIIPDITSKDIIQKCIETPGFYKDFEAILTNMNTKPLLRPLIKADSQYISLDHDGKVFSSDFSFVFWVKVDRNRIQGTNEKENFDIVLFQAEDRLKTNWFSVLLRYQNQQIHLSVESRNPTSTSKVDICDFTKPFDSYNDEWTLVALNVSNNKVAKITTLFSTHDQIQERKTSEFTAIKIGKGQLIIGSPKENQILKAKNLTNIAFGQLKYVSLYNRHFDIHSVIQLFNEEDFFNQNLICTTRNLKKPFLKSSDIKSSQEKFNSVNNSNFVDSLCIDENLEILLSKHQFGFVKSILENSSVSISDEFSLIDCFSSLPNKTFSTYIDIYETLSITLTRKEGKRFLFEILINPFLWKENITKITYHWSTILFSCIKNKLDEWDVFHHIASIFDTLYNEFEPATKNNLINFLGRIATTNLTKENFIQLCSIINNSMNEKKKPFWMMHLLRGIGYKIRNYKYHMPFKLFDQFLTDNDPELFAETICAVSNVYGPKFHNLVPIIKEKFDSMENKVAIFDSCLSLLKTEPNIVTLLLSFNVCHDRTKEVMDIMDGRQIYYGKGWFKELTELAAQSNEQFMNHLIMLLAQICSSIPDTKRRIIDLRHILFILFSKYSQKEGDDIDPVYTFISNYFAGRQTKDDITELSYWCLYTSLFTLVSKPGNSPFFANDEMNTLLQETYGKDKESNEIQTFIPHETSQIDKDNKIAFNLLIAPENTKSVSKDYVDSNKFTLIYNMIQTNNFDDYLFDVVFSHYNGDQTFKTIEQFEEYTNAIYDLQDKLKDISANEKKECDDIRTSVSLELEPSFISDLDESAEDAKQYFDDYKNKFAITA